MKEQTVSSKIIYDGKIIKVECDEVSVNGRLTTREVVHNAGGVSVLAFDKDNKLILVKQFRYPSKEELYEIPGGKAENGESKELAGMRELMEETGYVSNEFEYFGYFYPTVAYCSEVIHLVIAHNCTFKAQNLDPGEYVEVIKLDFEEALKMVYDNQIKDGKTLVAILKYANLTKERR